jgi:peptide-methionine (S)-S-oxide reductase
MHPVRLAASFAIVALATACRGHGGNQPAGAPTPAAEDPPAMSRSPDPAPSRASTQTATFANGCFWCTEAVLEQLPGVIDVVSGYMGGTVDRPSYEQVCSGTTGHAECVQIAFDPGRITYAELLDWFFRSHDPTTKDRQGADVGTQYRSAIFFHDQAQQEAALAAIARIQPTLPRPIVTEVTPASTFWPAEPYHQDYFRRNPQQGYCRAVIAPKLQKLGLDAGR